MITTSLYLDTRATKGNVAAPLKISVTKNGSTSYIPLGISLLPSQWDKNAKKVVSHPRKVFFNTYLAQKKLEVDEAVLFMMKSKGYASLTVTQIKNKIVEALTPTEEPAVTFADRLRKYADGCTPRTKAIYLATDRRLSAYCKNYERLTFDDITEDWLDGFNTFLSKTSPSRNARNIHFRNIRAVFNAAKRSKLTTNYPFDKGGFEIRPERTRKRSLTIDTLRKVFTTNLEPWQEKYRDMFMLTFLLIGINFKDICFLSSVVDGRVEYCRAKTKRLYSIKVEPEAQALIERYRGIKHLLYLIDRNEDYRIAYMQLCRGLAAVKKALGIPELTTYWARHSWATVAASLDIPRDTIAHALGHGGNTVTDIYIDFDQAKVDEANRRVIDLVLYGKK